MTDTRCLRAFRAAALLFLLPLLWLPRVQADTAQEAVTVRFDATSVRSDRAGEVDEAIPTNLVPWEPWAASGATLHDLFSETTYHVENWTNRADHAGLEFVNSSRSLIRLRVTVRLPAGLWRADAAVVPIYKADTSAAALTLLPETSATLPWRMESLSLVSEAETSKTLDVPPGTALFLRWTETGASAREARKAVRRACWTTSDRALQDRVSGALMPVDDILDALPTLVARGDRKKITTRIHTALLATAKAQALWDNGRGDSIADRDSAFTGLVTALSEVSCACFDLVPGETLIPAVTAGGKPEIRVTLTNAGSRTIPLVALGIDRRDGASQGSDRSVYRSVAPGATVIARFPTADPDAVRGIVQFLSDMGAATVFAAPDGPPR